MPSWRAAPGLQARRRGSIYFDAGTSFNPSAESLSLSAATANLPPEKNRTYEVGHQVGSSRQGISRCAARCSAPTKHNAREPDPDNPLLNVLAGKQRVTASQAERTAT